MTPRRLVQIAGPVLVLIALVIALGAVFALDDGDALITDPPIEAEDPDAEEHGL